MAERCVFCELGDRREGNIWDGELFYSFLDNFPVSPGHALIIPRRHVVAVDDLSREEWLALLPSIRKVIEVVERVDLRKVYEEKLKDPLSEISSWFLRQAISHPRINTKPDA